jgi:hypothetical protein
MSRLGASRKHGLRLSLLFVLVAALALGIVWVAAGRSATELTDRVLTIAVALPPVETRTFDGEGFRAAGLSLTFGGPDNQRSDVKLCTDVPKRIVLASGGRRFVLGPRTNPIDASGRPDLDFVPDRGDTLSLTATRSLVGWPTPFEVDFMTSPPSWKRYVYYRLIWRKSSGAELRMSWRYEQDYFRGRGWTTPVMMWNFHTGLLGVDIRP